MLADQSRSGTTPAPPTSRAQLSWSGFVLSLLAVGACTSIDAGREPRIVLDRPLVLALAPVDRPVVSVVLDGRGPSPFLVDSGFGVTMIAANRANELGFESRPYARASETTGAGGGKTSAERYVDVGLVEIGGLDVRDARIALLDDPALARAGVSGVLGQDVLARLTLIIDMQRLEMHVLPHGGVDVLREYISTRGFGVGAWTPLRADFRPSPFLPLTVAGVEIEVEIDTGAGSTDLPARAIEQLGLERIGTQWISAVGGTYTSDLYRFADLSLFGLEFDAVVGTTTREYGLLGMDILGRLVFVLDGPAGTVWIQRRE
jgi:predicted aspartyl protease